MIIKAVLCTDLGVVLTVESNFVTKQSVGVSRWRALLWFLHVLQDFSMVFTDT